MHHTKVNMNTILGQGICKFFLTTVGAAFPQGTHYAIYGIDTNCKPLKKYEKRRYMGLLNISMLVSIAREQGSLIVQD